MDCWEPQDKAFHANSRQGWSADPYGGTYPHAGAPPPAVRGHWPGEGIALPRPRLIDSDFWSLLVERRSIREPKGLDARDLSAILDLFRICETGQGGRYTALRKAMPSAGGMHGLEAYVALNGCEGVSDGLWHYAADDGRLYRVLGATIEYHALLEDASRSADVEHRPAVLLILAARFARWQWKYRRMAYAAILKDVGVAYGYLSLLATALALNTCPLGGGDSELFARATGLDPWGEGSVGEWAVW